MHVPKTAGSTINFYLRSSLPNGQDHCEAIIQNDDALSVAANEMDWLSGHVDIDTAEARLRSVTSRQIRFFTIIRSPSDQVMSHYNWLIEIFHKGPEFYNLHPDAIKEISEEIRCSLGDAETIIDNLKLYDGLFRNCQSKWVLGNDFELDEAKIYNKIEKYEMIVDTSRASLLLGLITGRRVKRPVRENASTYHFDTGVFRTEKVKNFLRYWNAYDEALYKIVMAGKKEGIWSKADKVIDMFRFPYRRHLRT